MPDIGAGGCGDEASTTGDDNNSNKTNEIIKPVRKRGRPAASTKKKTDVTVTTNDDSAMTHRCARDSAANVNAAASTKKKTYVTVTTNSASGDSSIARSAAMTTRV